VLSQKKVELGGVVLHVAHAVQQQLGKAQIERSPLAPLARFPDCWRPRASSA